MRQELRVAGATWVLRYKTTRREDGKRVERTVAVGLVRNYPSESAALQGVDVLHLRESINTNEDFKVRPVRFADIAAHYIAHELDNDQADAIMPKSHTTISNYRRNLKKRIIPQWGGRVFASFKLKGRKPRVANMPVADHLRPAAVASGVINEGDKVRWGFHNLRHSLESFLVQAGKDPKTVQALLRHADVKTTLQIYAHGRSEDRMAAQGDVQD